MIAPPPTTDAPTDDELAFIDEAAAYLEHPSFAQRASRLIGKPVEALIHRLPAPATRALDAAGEVALRKAMNIALIGLPRRHPPTAGLDLRGQVASTFAMGQQRTVAVGAAGFVGGLLGGFTLGAELSASTVLMLRAIADIAARLGADLDDPADRLECVAVFALGSGRPHSVATGDPVTTLEGVAASETAYYAARIGLQRAATEVAHMAAGASAEQVAKMLLRSKSPVVAELVGKILARYGVVVSQKSAFQLLPVVGAATAAAINVAFLDHYHQVARYHFGLRQLERRWGGSVVRARYERAAQGLLAVPTTGR